MKRRLMVKFVLGMLMILVFLVSVVIGLKLFNKLAILLNIPEIFEMYLLTLIFSTLAFIVKSMED